MAARKGEPHCIGYQPRSPTYLAIFRETIKRYPGRDRRQVLLDLIEARGERGKWFAAAKDAGLLAEE